MVQTLRIIETQDLQEIYRVLNFIQVKEDKEFLQSFGGQEP